MLRHRTIAASPLRSASESWQVITDLVADTIAASAYLDRTDVIAAMSKAAAAGRMLIAGGHLDRHPLTLTAGSVHCEITTVSGASALTTEESLGPVPGAAGARDYTIYLPSPDPLQDVIAAAVAGHEHLSDGEPPPHSTRTATAGPLINVDKLREAVAKP